MGREHLKVFNGNTCLPGDYATSTNAILAKRRSGKTYTASVIAEELVRIEQPWVALDPTGAWWGLRAPASPPVKYGKGLPVVILGGAHGDVPLEATGGRVVADLVVDTPGFYVLDLSSLGTRRAEVRFAGEFADRLYRRKQSERTPLHLFVDEAEMFVPQRMERDETTMLGAFESIVKRGGILGLGSTLISQRAAAVNKHVLEQIDRLIALRTVGPNDTQAILNYVSAYAGAEQTAEIKRSLGRLELGEAWIYEPGAEVLLRQVVRRRRTFNSSATPEPGDAAVAPKLAAVDLDVLREKLAATIEKAAADDPHLLRVEIEKLKIRLREKEVPVELAVEKIVRVEVPVIDRPALEAAQAALTEFAASLGALHSEVQIRFEEIGRKLSEQSAVLRAAVDKAAQAHVERVTDAARRVVENSGKIQYTQPDPAKQFRQETIAATGGDLTGPQRRVLSVLAQHGPCGKARLAMMAGYSQKGGAFNNVLSQLRTAELISRGDPIGITGHGEVSLGAWENLPTGPALFDFWLRHDKVDGPGRKIMEALAVHEQEAGRGMTKVELGEATGSVHTGGSFNNAISRLRTLGVVEKGQPGTPVRLVETLREAILEPAGVS